MDTAPHLTHDHREVDRPRGCIDRHRLGADAGEQRIPAHVDGVDDRRGSVGVLVETGDVGQLRPSEIVVGGHVRAGSVTRRHDLLCRVPHVRQEPRLEVAERARHDGGLDIAEHAAAAEEVHPEAVEAEALGLGDGVWVEVERRTDVARLRGDGGDGLTRIHGASSHSSPPDDEPGSAWASSSGAVGLISRRRSCGSRRSFRRRGSRRRPWRRAAPTDPWPPRARPAPCRHARSRRRCRAR